ncbi:MAG: ATP-binding cassette domain-containing protein [Bacteroidales bacterium]|nr:ATP-binding cassette domain-containing protein [Bacteroidales bacterium]
MLHVNNLHIEAGSFVIPSVSFRVKPGEYFFLLGESGAGKSLILEAIAGIQPLQSGSIRVNGEDITHRPYHRRKVGMVFQNLALFPHLTVFQNLAFALKIQKSATHEIVSAVDAMARRMSIGHLLKRKPGTLSGGEHQRVALARTLIMNPAVLLLDEPLSSLDILLKEEMTSVLKEVHRSGQTILHVTHDYRVVNYLADQIAIIGKGVLLQQGTPDEIRRNPCNALARHVGAPEG